MAQNPQKSIAILHYTAPPVVGGVEAVIAAQARLFLDEGYRIAVVSGRGDSAALPKGVEFLSILEMDSQHPELRQLNHQLVKGDLPAEFDSLVRRLFDSLEPVLADFDYVIVHNIFTKHFNLPLTAALFRLLDENLLPGCIAWNHDFSWTSPASHRSVHPGYPWDLLRTYREDITYVTISEGRRQELAGMLEISPEKIHVIYNGVDPQAQLGLSPTGWALVQKLGLMDGDLNLLMPVRVTHAKNIELALEVTAALKERGLRPRLVLTGPPDPHDEKSAAYFQSLQDRRRSLRVDKEMRFVYESGPQPGEPYTIEPDLVGQLYRVCDVMLMPSLREGFGMPVLEAGLAGLKVVCTRIPAAEELASEEVLWIDAQEGAESIADRLIEWAASDPVQRLRRRVRQDLTWPALFKKQIRPLLSGESA
jgi:mannosylglucosylglycerate synthase